MTKVLITGGSGLIGRHLSRKLTENGYEVSIIRRRNVNRIDASVYHWDIEKAIIDQEAINASDYIIHLAGANIGKRRWTLKRKKEIIESRIKSAELIGQNLNKEKHNLKAFISASAIGYYGSITSDKIFKETDSSAEDFLGTTCNRWEESAERMGDLGPRVVKIRTGIVLSKSGGLLSRFQLPAKLGLGFVLGDGKQFMPWIHIEDLCNIYLKAIQNADMKGSYNAVAPEHITNKEFTRKITSRYRNALWLPYIPTRLIKLIFGEMATMLLNGSRVSSEKLQAEGFDFCFPNMDSALQDLYK
jgi:uncharacterized protein (TIGR01777 family)